MNLKLKIKFYYLTKNYQKLKQLIVDDEASLKYLNDMQINEILKYAVANEEYILFYTLLQSLTDDAILSHQELANEYIKSYYHKFFHNPIFLYGIASIMARNPEQYKKEIATINEDIINKPLSEIAIYIHNLNGFRNEKMEDKVLSSNNTRFWTCLFEDISLEAKKNLISKIIQNYPQKINFLAYALKAREEELMELKNDILALDCDKKIKGEYLFYIYQATKANPNPLLIDDIILLNDFNTTKRLMETLKEEEQTLLLKRYLFNFSEDITFTLACTSNCENTSFLIDKALNDITDAKLVFLIMQVNEKYLPYVLNKTLKEEKVALKLINNLYLLGSKRWLNIINYIKNQRESVLSKDELKKLEMFADNTLSRKRTLT